MSKKLQRITKFINGENLSWRNTKIFEIANQQMGVKGSILMFKKWLYLRHLTGSMDVLCHKQKGNSSLSDREFPPVVETKRRQLIPVSVAWTDDIPHFGHQTHRLSEFYLVSSHLPAPFIFWATRTRKLRVLSSQQPKRV